MRKRNQLFMLLAGFGAASGLALTSCNDYTTGQPGEPDGPLMITRTTLFDGNREGGAAPVFTDTSAPADCTDPAVSNTDKCQGDPYKDRFGLKKSPPTPDSGQDIRVVFNKLPLLLNGMDMEKITKEAMRPPTKIELADFAKNVLKLACTTCSGTPPYEVNLQLTGSDLNPDPTGENGFAFSYGPSIQIATSTDDPLVALEPDTDYQVTVDPGLSGRDGNKVQLDASAMNLLRFKTEPFRVLQAGIGDPDNDTWVYHDGDSPMLSVEGVATDGVIALMLNASIDPSVFKGATVTATLKGAPVAVKIGLNQITKDKMMNDVCDPGNQRTLYVYPVGGAWAAMAAEGDEVTITIKGADVRDVSQADGHPAGMGKHTLKTDLVISAKLSGAAADDKYTGLTAGGVAADDDCPTTMMNEDMGAGDMSVADQGNRG